MRLVADGHLNKALKLPDERKHDNTETTDSGQLAASGQCVNAEPSRTKKLVSRAVMATSLEFHEPGVVSTSTESIVDSSLLCKSSPTFATQARAFRLEIFLTKAPKAAKLHGDLSVQNQQNHCRA